SPPPTQLHPHPPAPPAPIPIGFPLALPLGTLSPFLKISQSWCPQDALRSSRGFKTVKTLRIQISGPRVVSKSFSASQINHLRAQQPLLRPAAYSINGVVLSSARRLPSPRYPQETSSGLYHNVDHSRRYSRVDFDCFLIPVSPYTHLLPLMTTRGGFNRTVFCWSDELAHFFLSDAKLTPSAACTILAPESSKFYTGDSTGMPNNHLTHVHLCIQFNNCDVLLMRALAGRSCEVFSCLHEETHAADPLSTTTALLLRLGSRIPGTYCASHAYSRARLNFPECLVLPS
ncbi:hypothetical protein FB451DRAFT_370094, partial [Mycena latifolia]